MLKRLAICCATLLFPIAAQAAQRVALVIGNSAYKDATELANPSHDASDFAATLQKYGFEVVLGLDLDKAGFEAKVRQFALALRGADAGAFFYAGHGLQVAGQNFLVPIDAKLNNAEDLDFEAIRLDIIQRIMEREAKANVLFLDACRNNPFTRSLARSLGRRAIDVGQGLAPIESNVGTLISYSTQPGNVALDGTGRNSPYSGALVKELMVSNDDLSAILIAVRNEVMRVSDNQQVPWEHSALRARFFIATPGAQVLPTPGPQSEAEKAWLLLKESAEAEKIIAFRAKYGEKNPQHDQLARQRLESLISTSATTSETAPAGAMSEEAARALIRDVFTHVRADYPETTNEASLVARGLGRLVDMFPGSLNKSALEGRLARLVPSEVEGASDLLVDIFMGVQRVYGRWSSPESLMERVLNAVLRGLDAQTSYLGPKSYLQWQSSMKGDFGGVGLEVRLENGFLKVIAPIDDTPAAKAGLKPSDIIVEIDGKTVQGLSIEQAVARLKGPANTPVTVKFERAKSPGPIQVQLVRDTIKIIPVKGRLEGDVAYIKISTFNQQTRPAFLAKVAELKKAAGDRLKGYVLDLRNNSGGLMNSATAIADDLLDSGTVFSAKGRRADATQTMAAKAGDIADGKPVVILANVGTTSGAEILTAALQENKRATVIGTRTFGKGTIQTMFPLGDRGAVRVTTGRFATPNGREIETIGVAPDVLIESDTRRDAPLDAALARLNPAVGK